MRLENNFKNKKCLFYYLKMFYKFQITKISNLNIFGAYFAKKRQPHIKLFFLFSEQVKIVPVAVAGQ